MTLLLMAAGSGSRYGKLKQFDDLGPAKEFLMEFSIFDALKNNFNHIVVITKAANKSFLESHHSQKTVGSDNCDLVRRLHHVHTAKDKSFSLLLSRICGCNSSLDF